MVNAKRIYRQYDQENLKVRSVERKKIRRRQRVAQGSATGPNQCLSADFVSDKLTDGRSYRILTLIDQFTRECVAMEAGRSLRGRHVVASLTRAITERGKAPRSITLDNGSEFTAVRWKPGRFSRVSSYASSAQDAHGERLHRKLQRSTARLMPERRVVRISSSCTRKTGAMAGPLQPATSTQRLGRSNASFIRRRPRSIGSVLHPDRTEYGKLRIASRVSCVGKERRP